MRVPGSATTKATISFPTATTGPVQMDAGPQLVRPKPCFRNMPVVMEMIEKAIANSRK